MRRTSPSAAFLVEACRAGCACGSEALATAWSVEHREATLALLEAHRVTALTLGRLEQLGALEALEPALGRQLSERLRQLRRGAALLDLESERIAEGMAHEGVPPVLLKGAALGRTLYESVGDRRSADIDLLVARGALEPALGALQKLGFVSRLAPATQQAYREHHFHLQLHDAHGTCVELHWDVCRPRDAYALDPAALIDSARPLGDGDPLRVPAPEHLLLLVVLQHLQEGFSCFARLVDIDRLIRRTPELDWSTIGAAAEAGMLRAPLALALQLARNLLGSPVERERIDALLPPGLARGQLALLCPERLLLERLARRRAATARVLDWWLLPDGRARLAGLGRELLGEEDDPLQRFWRGERGGPGPIRRVLQLSKAALLQLGCWLGGLRPGRQRFWR